MFFHSYITTMPPKRKHKPQATILQPHKVRPCKYAWDGLEVKPSKEKGAGMGVFATKVLPVGTMIPIVGQHHPGATPSALTHSWEYYGKARGYVDGNPSIKPFKKVGSYGLAIAMMLNESTTKILTCKFHLDHVVVATRLKAGDELTVYYGNAYDRHRKQQGYTMIKNKHLERGYDAYDNLSFPPATVRYENINKWNTVIKQCQIRSDKFKTAQKTDLTVASIWDYPGLIPT
jgi:hypothetical protein